MSCGNKSCLQSELKWDEFFCEWNNCFVFACDRCTLLVGYAILMLVYTLLYDVLRIQCGNQRNISVANQFLKAVSCSMCKVACNSAGTDVIFYLTAIYNTFTVMTSAVPCLTVAPFSLTAFLDAIYDNGSPEIVGVINPLLLRIPLTNVLTVDFSGDVPLTFASLGTPLDADIYLLNPAVQFPGPCDVVVPPAP